MGEARGSCPKSPACHESLDHAQVDGADDGMGAGAIHEGAGRQIAAPLIFSDGLRPEPQVFQDVQRQSGRVGR